MWATYSWYLPSWTPTYLRRPKAVGLKAYIAPASWLVRALEPQDMRFFVSIRFLIPSRRALLFFRRAPVLCPCLSQGSRYFISSSATNCFSFHYAVPRLGCPPLSVEWGASCPPQGISRGMPSCSGERDISCPWTHQSADYDVLRSQPPGQYMLLRLDLLLGRSEHEPLHLRL